VKAERKHGQNDDHNPGTPGEYEIEITAEGPIRIDALNAEAASQTVPFH
jgi:hypothetical protein